MSESDEWWDEEPIHPMIGAAVPGAPMEESDDPLDLRWRALYIPDLSAQAGWSVHRVRDRSPVPQMWVRRAGFRMSGRRR